MKNVQDQPEHNSSSWLNYLASAAFFVVLAFFAFQFVRFTKFPIGEDPAVHIHTVKTTSYLNLRTELYPIPLAIYKAAGQLTGIELPRLFIYVITSYFLFATIMLFFLVAKGYGNPSVAVAASLFFVTSRWANDSLRMGVLGEVFGWGMLLLTLYWLAKNNIPMTIISSIFLAFSHPFAFTVFVIIFVLYVIISLFAHDEKERKIMLILMSIYAGLAVVACFTAPEVIRKFLLFRSADPAGWGERSLWELISSDNYQRIFTALFSLFGLIVAAKEWHRPIVKILYLLLATGLFLSMNHLFGVHFLPFRFYGFLEMGMAIFAGIGLAYFIQQFSLPIYLQVGVTLIIAIVLAWPHYKVNEKYIRWQTTDPHAKAMMFPADLAALNWIRDNTSPNATFMTDHQHGVWMIALADRDKVAYSDILDKGDDLKVYLAEGNKINADYLYYSAIQGIPDQISKNYTVVYNVNQVRILKSNATRR